MDMTGATGDVGSPVLKNHIKIDDRTVDALGGPAAGGGMFGGPGFGFGGLGAGLGLGVLGGAALGGYGYGGCGYGGGGYGAGLGSPLGVGFVGFGLAELAAVARNEGLRAEIGAVGREQRAITGVVGRDVLLTQTQIAQTEGRTRELLLQSQIALMQQANGNTTAILAAIEREARAAAAEGRNISSVISNSVAQLALAQQAGFAAGREQATFNTNSLAASSVSQANALSAQVAGLQCLEQQCCQAQGDGRRAIQDDIAASLAAMQQAIRALQATVCNVGTQANVNAATIAATVGTSPHTVPFPGGACSGNGAVAGC